jgi:hypothetical protein
VAHLCAGPVQGRVCEGRGGATQGGDAVNDGEQSVPRARPSGGGEGTNLLGLASEERIWGDQKRISGDQVPNDANS